MFNAIKNLTAYNLVTSCSLIMLLAFTCSTPAAFAYTSSTEPQTQTQQKSLTVDEIAAKLSLAMNKKSTEPKLLKNLLSELKNQVNITVEQQHKVTFLTAYQELYAGQYNISRERFNRLLQSNASKLLKFKANYLLAHIAITTHDWLTGLKHIADNANLAAEIKDKESLQSNLLATTIFYSQLGQYQLALDYIDKLSQQKLSPNNNCIFKQLSLEAKFNLNTLKLTSNEFENAINTCIDADFIVTANLVRIHKAKLYLQENLPQVAQGIMLANLEEVNATQYPILIAEMNNVLAKAYLLNNDQANAQKHAQAALDVNANMSNLLQGVETYRLLYQLAKNEQNLTDALYYLEQYSSIEKAQLKAEEAKHLAFQMAQHRAAEQANKIKLLNERNNYLQAEQALAETKVDNRHLLLVLLTFIIIMLTAFGLRLRREHKRVKQLAEYDALTGIFNRGHLVQASLSALEHCESMRKDLSVIMFDIDHFKSINDSHGHPCGDWALKTIVKTCQDITRQDDIFARLGGEEFCIILPSCSIDIAIAQAEACRKAIAAIKTQDSGCEFSLTASFGITDVKRSGFNLDKLLADADYATYASKNNDRNRVTVFQAAEEENTPITPPVKQHS